MLKCFFLRNIFFAKNSVAALRRRKLSDFSNEVWVAVSRSCESTTSRVFQNESFLSWFVSEDAVVAENRGMDTEVPEIWFN